MTKQAYQAKIKRQNRQEIEALSERCLEIHEALDVATGKDREQLLAELDAARVRIATLEWINEGR